MTINKVHTILLDKPIVLGIQKGDLALVDGLIVAVIKNSLLQAGKYSGFCVMTQEQLAWKVGVSRQTTNSSLTKLDKSQWITRVLSNTSPRRFRYCLGPTYATYLELSSSDNPYEGMSVPFSASEEIVPILQNKAEAPGGLPTLENPHQDLYASASMWTVSPFKFTEETMLQSQGQVQKALARLNSYLWEYGSTDVQEKITRLHGIAGKAQGDSAKFIPGALTFYLGETKAGKATRSLYSDVSEWETAFSVAHTPSAAASEEAFNVVWHEASDTGLSIKSMLSKLLPMIKTCEYARKTYDTADRLLSALYQNQKVMRGFEDIRLIWSTDSEEFKSEVTNKLIRKG